MLLAQACHASTAFFEAVYLISRSTVIGSNSAAVMFNYSAYIKFCKIVTFKNSFLRLSSSYCSNLSCPKLKYAETTVCRLLRSLILIIFYGIMHS